MIFQIFCVGTTVADEFNMNRRAVLDRNPCVFPHFVLQFYMGISNWLRFVGLNVRVYSDNLMLERWIS
jgi:hypothetical protein